MLLTFIGGAFLYSIYRLIKHRRKFVIRTFNEILDEILGASIWKQLGYLFLMSLTAFLFSWLLVDALSPRDALCSSEITNNHNTFWLTICYFFDPGNLNLTPHAEPGWQGGG